MHTGQYVIKVYDVDNGIKYLTEPAVMSEQLINGISPTPSTVPSTVHLLPSSSSTSSTGTGKLFCLCLTFSIIMQLIKQCNITQML